LPRELEKMRLVGDLTRRALSCFRPVLASPDGGESGRKVSEITGLGENLSMFFASGLA